MHKNLLNTINNYKKNKTTYGLGNEYFNDDTLYPKNKIYNADHKGFEIDLGSFTLVI